MAQFDPNDPNIYAQLFGQVPQQGTSYVPPQVPQQPVVPEPMQEEFVPAEPYSGLGVRNLEFPEVTLPQESAAPQGGTSSGQGGSRSVGGSTSTSESSSTPRLEKLEYTAPEIAEDPDVEAKRRAGNLIRARDNVLDADQAGLKAGQAVIAQGAEAAQKLAKQDTIDAKSMARFTAEANAEADARVQGITNAVDAVKSMKVDPARLWGKPGSMQNVAGIAAAFMGGFLQPVLGTNTAQQIIDNAIERDINAQKSDINNAQQNVSNLKMLHSLGLDQAETEAEQRSQQRLLMRAGMAGHFEAEALKLQDPVLAAKYQRQGADITQQVFKDIDQMHADVRDKHFSRSVSQAQLELQAQRFVEEKRSNKAAESFRLSESEYKREQDAKAAGAMEAEWRRNLVPIATGFTHTDDSQIHIPTGSGETLGNRQRESIDQKSMKLQSQGNIADALIKQAPGRLGTPKSAERQMTAALASQMFLSAGESMSKLSDRDLALIKDSYGGDFNKFIREGNEKDIRRVLHQFKNNSVMEGQALADTIGDDVKFKLIPDDRYLGEFATLIGEAPKEVSMSKEQHQAKWSSPDLAPEEKADALVDFLQAGTGDQETLLLTPNDPVVRDAVEQWRALPEAAKKKYKRREGNEGGRKVFLGEDIGGGLEGLEAIGGTQHRRLLDKQKAEEEEAQQILNTRSGRAGIW